MQDFFIMIFLSAGVHWTVDLFTHSESRESINNRHKEKAFSVSEPLPSASDLADIFSEHLKIIHAFEDQSVYIVSGRM